MITPREKLEHAESIAGNPNVKALIRETIEALWPPAKLIVGLNGLAGWGPAHQKVMEGVTHVDRDRLDIGSGSASNLEWLREVCATGCKPLVLYNPGLAGRSTAAIEADLIPIVTLMERYELELLEFGNEVQAHGTLPPEYAMQAQAAMKILTPRITLIVNGGGEYERADGTWSQVPAGHGWCKDFCEAFGGPPPAWSFHPYGPMTARGITDSSLEPAGWLTLLRLIEVLKQQGIYAPIHVTEVGQPTWTGSDGRPAVSEVEQAAAIRMYVQDCIEWNVASLYIFGSIDGLNPKQAQEAGLPGPGEGGYGLWKRNSEGEVGPPKPAAYALGEAVAAL